jgi:rhamnogalacturonan endolyase
VVDQVPATVNLYLMTHRERSKMTKLFILSVLILVAALPGRAAVLLDDDYRALAPGLLSPGVVGAHAEYHYLPETAPKGNWTASAFLTPASQRAWRLIEENGERLLWQSYTATENERAYIHPMLTAGDELWSDYTVELRFAPEGESGRSGIAFRQHTDRVYYFAGVIGQKAVLKKINNGSAFRQLDETVLAEKPFSWKPGEFITLKVTAKGDQLTAEFRCETTNHSKVGRALHARRQTPDDVVPHSRRAEDCAPYLEGSADKDSMVKLKARDASFKQGKIGYTADVPTKYAKVLVSCPASAKRVFEKARKAREAGEARLQAGNPKMVLWRKIATPDFGVGRNLRFGDLDGDGRLDILIVQQNAHGPKDRNSEVGCLTAINLDGKILWQNGNPDPWRDQLTSDVAVQIHDLDGDGKNEVIYCRNLEIVVADGATGKTKYSAPTPETPVVPGQTNRFSRILGDSLFFCDLRGLGADRDIILKDRYRNLWAYTDKLEPLWHLTLNTGHYPYACDVDGDGKDELAIGYSLVSSNGKIIWSLDDQLKDHADGVAILPFKAGAELRFLCAASDEGFILADLKGKILEHLQLGHVQNPTVADFRPDLPGLETVTINFWGNQGIVNLFDADGKLYHDFQPVAHGSMMLPLNWKGDGQEYWILSPNPVYGGAYDGWGRRALRFPADGHPDRCAAALDLTGDGRDEIVVWDPWELWIYTQSDSPKSGKLYRPKRNPLYNESNYRANVSLPGWTESLL